MSIKVQQFSKEKIGKNQVLIFLHISKASGSTLHSILEKQYKDIGHFIVVGGPENNDNQRLDGLANKERENLGVIRGHVNYGVHEMLAKPSTYITILRDPVARVISNYYYIKGDQNHYLYKDYISENWTLEDYIYKTVENDNGQTRALTGLLDVYSFFKKEQSVIPFGECTDDMLEIAKKNLAQFAGVGLTEKFDESLILFKRSLGWDAPPTYIKQNVNQERPRIKDIPEETIQLIKENNHYDIQLYEYACKLFEKQISRQDVSFEVELKYFKALNQSFQAQQSLIEEHENLQQKYQILDEEHHFLRQTRAVKILKKLERYPAILKVISSLYEFINKVFQPLKGR